MEKTPLWIIALICFIVISLFTPPFTELRNFFGAALSGDADESFFEELFNSVSHAVGTLLAVWVMYFIILLAIHYRKSWHHWLGLTVYGLSLVILYALSTIYHTAGLIFENDKEKMYIFRILDHIGIFYLIAGSYTPLVLLIMVKRSKHVISGYLLLGFVWGCAIGGTMMKLLIHIDDAPLWVHASFYLLMGFAVVFAFKPIYYLSLGGFFYSFGVAFLLWDSLWFNHGIWHLFVMAGSAFQFLAIMMSSLPHMKRTSEIYTMQSAPVKIKDALEELIAESLDGKEPKKDEHKSL